MTQLETYQRQIRKHLDEMDRAIGALAARAERLTSENKLDCEEELQELRLVQRDASSKLEQLEEAVEDDWNKIKREVDAAIEKLRKAYDRLQNIISSTSL